MQIHESLWEVLYVMKCSLGVPSCLFHVYWACTRFRLLFAVCLVVYLNKHHIDNDVMLNCITHSRDQPPLKSTLFQLKVYANIRPLKSANGRYVFNFVLHLILDKDKYKLSLEFDAILSGLSIGQLRTCPVLSVMFERHISKKHRLV